MARNALTKITFTKTGYNLTDSADFTTMSTGSGNGETFSFNANDVVVLKNGTGGDAVYTFKVPGESKYSDYGAVIADDTVTVGTGDTWLRPLNKIFKQSDGDVYVDCDVAGSIMVLTK